MVTLTLSFTLNRKRRKMEIISYFLVEVSATILFCVCILNYIIAFVFTGAIRKDKKCECKLLTMCRKLPYHSFIGSFVSFLVRGTRN
jgi:hypothetical protein